MPFLQHFRLGRAGLEGAALSSTNYRPDIDGLRTLAVLPVILFHAGVPGFGGGYVGVDVFFVISGYLIAGILLSDLERGRYSIARFYERRVRRIFPALAVVVAATLAIGAAIETPAVLTDIAKSALAVGVFASNFFFWKSTNYFADAHAAQPLLHTWSLAVEEQFYIVFPPFLALLFRRRRFIVPVMAILALLSFVAAAWLVHVKPSATFYLPFTRAWELLAGVLIAAGPVSTRVSAGLRGAAGAVGLALLVLPVFLYTSTTVFPGVSALPPVLGTVLIIWSGQAGPTPVARLLALRPLVWIGLISYSLYLWHVPILSYGAYLAGGTMPAWARVAAIAATFALAWASYRWIETPFRSGEGFRIRRPVRVAVAAMLVTVGAGGALAATHGWPGRLDARAQMLVDTQADNHRYHDECMSDDAYVVSVEHPCRLGTPGVAPSVLVWGDSHSVVTASALEPVARSHGFAMLFAATADCPVGIGFTIDEDHVPSLTRTPAYRSCGPYNSAMLRLALATPSIRTVVLSARWTNWRIGEPANPAEDPVDLRLRDATGVAPSSAGNAAIFARGFLRLLHALHDGGKRVIVVGPLPEPPFNVPTRLFLERFGTLPHAGPITEAEYRQRHRRILAFFDDIERQGLATFVWPAEALCRDGICPIEAADGPVFFDHNHLSMHAAHRTSYMYDALFPAAPPDQRNCVGGTAGKR